MRHRVRRQPVQLLLIGPAPLHQQHDFATLHFLCTATIDRIQLLLRHISSFTPPRSHFLSLPYPTPHPQFSAYLASSVHRSYLPTNRINNRTTNTWTTTTCYSAIPLYRHMTPRPMLPTSTLFCLQPRSCYLVVYYSTSISGLSGDSLVLQLID